MVVILLAGFTAHRFEVWRLQRQQLKLDANLALDPHSQRWPAGVTVVGVGRDYASIGAILDKLAALLDIRYKRQQAGKLVTVVCDEWLSIIDNVPEAADRLKLLLTEGRKVNIHLFLGSHTDRARQLGLTGLADLRDGMSIVYLSWNPRTDTRAAEIVLNGERLPITTPPPVAVGQAQVLRVAPLAAKPNSDEARILALYQQGETISAIATAVFGSKGGHQNQWVKHTLKKHGVTV